MLFIKHIQDKVRIPVILARNFGKLQCIMAKDFVSISLYVGITTDVLAHKK
jgi:hypothetical protein